MKRETRIKKILALREGELDKARTVLASANRDLEVARETTRQAVARANLAKARHDEMLKGGTLDVTGWADSEAWVLSEEKRIEICAEAEAEATAHMVRCRESVVVAQGNVDRIKALLERMAKAEAQVEVRKERKLEDEFARRAFGGTPSDE